MIHFINKIFLGGWRSNWKLSVMMVVSRIMKLFCVILMQQLFVIKIVEVKLIIKIEKIMIVLLFLLMCQSVTAKLWILNKMFTK